MRKLLSLAFFALLLTTTAAAQPPPLNKLIRTLDGQFTIAYPVDWFAAEVDNQLVLASSADLIAALGQLPPLRGADAVLILPTQLFGDDLEDAVEALRERDDVTIADDAELEIGEAAAVFFERDDAFDATYLLQTEAGVVQLLVAGNPPPDLAEAMLSTLDVLPDAPESLADEDRIPLVRTFLAPSVGVRLDYPTDASVLEGAEAGLVIIADGPQTMGLTLFEEDYELAPGQYSITVYRVEALGLDAETAEDAMEALVDGLGGGVDTDPRDLFGTEAVAFDVETDAYDGATYALQTDTGDILIAIAEAAPGTYEPLRPLVESVLASVQSAEGEPVTLSPATD